VCRVELIDPLAAIAPVRKQRTPKGSRRLLDETFARLSFQELPFRVQKAASRFCRRECLRILTHSHAPQLLDREALHSLSVNGACSSRSQLAVNLLSKNHLTSQTDRPAPCRTSEADSSPCDVRSVGEFRYALRSCQAKFRRNRKNNSETRSDSAGHFPYPGKRRVEPNSDFFMGVGRSHRVERDAVKEDEVPRSPGCGEDVLIEWDAVRRRCSSIRRWYRCARSNSSVMRASRSSCWSGDSSGGWNASGFRRGMMGRAIITCAYLARNQGKLLVGEISVPFCERQNSSF
jgi:hypothetical protein